MRYKDAVYAAMFSGWKNVVKKDMVSGNGFVIAWYGIKLIFRYVLFFIILLLLAITAPISAFIIIKMEKINEAHEERIRAAIDDDL